jgi:hypothetical protein
MFLYFIYVFMFIFALLILYIVVKLEKIVLINSNNKMLSCSHFFSLRELLNWVNEISSSISLSLSLFL